MKKSSIVISLYALFILIGGLMGFIKAGSYASIITAGSIACLLFICAYFVWKGHLAALKATFALQTFLFFFFSYRFYLSAKWMPAGMMIILSFLSLLYLFIQEKAFLLPRQSQR